MSSRFSVLLLEADGRLIHADKPPTMTILKFLQSIVGGFVESIRTPFSGVDGWINEEGKWVHPQMNAQGTNLLLEVLSPGDYIAGPLVFTGAPDEEGVTQGLDDASVQAIQARLEALHQNA